MSAKEICEEFESHFNEPILNFLEVGRCIGYGEDDMDCYMIIKNHDGEVVWHSAVGGYTYLTPLANQNARTGPEGEHWDDFNRLDDWLERNGCPKEPDFRIEFNYTERDYDDIQS